MNRQTLAWSKHRDLWNKVLYGTPGDALEAASALYKLGEMSDFIFQTVFLTICHAAKEEKAAKNKKGRRHK